eukprot:tig00000403_g337.t1
MSAQGAAFASPLLATPARRVSTSIVAPRAARLVRAAPAAAEKRFFGSLPAIRSCRRRALAFGVFASAEASKPSDELLQQNAGLWSKMTLLGNLHSLSTDLEAGVREASNILVVGGCGALGADVCEKFKSSGFPVISADLRASEVAPENIVLGAEGGFPEQAERAVADAEKLFGERKCKAVICVAGGWAGGNASSKKLFETADLMIRQSVHSSLVAAKLATRLLDKDGLLVLTGSAAALQGTPGMLGYGLAKAAVHQLAASLAGEKSGLPEGATVLAIVPVVLDTPGNRGGDTTIHDDWTQLGDVSRLLHTWVTNKKQRPPSGSLVEIRTKDFKTETRVLAFGPAH